MDGLPIRGVMWLVGLVIFNAIVEAMVTAFESVSESAVEKRLEEGEKKAKRVNFLLEHHRRYITVTDILRLVAVSGMGLVYYIYFLPYFKEILQKSVKTSASAVLVAVLLVLITFLVIMIIELFAIKFPKKLAFKHAEGFAFAFAGLLRLFIVVLGPAAWLIETITIGILKLFHIKASELEEVVTEEALISTVEEAAESGVLEADEVEMIQNIFEFDNKEVKDIMTHRTNMVLVDADWTLEEAVKFMLNEVYSRFPVYEDSEENIIGIVHLKDALKVYMSGNAGKMKQRKIRSITRKPFLVPDTQSIDILLENMQKKKFHMAFAIDEYGQTAGLVTLEDVLEEIVGDIQDEYDREEEDTVSEAENVYLVKGLTTLADLSEDMGHEITSEDFETLNGLIVCALGHIPSEGEQFTMTYQGCQIDIVEVKNKMITLARVTVLPEEEASEEEEE